MKFSYDLPSVRHNDRLSGPDLSHILTESILQFTQPNGLHILNVASRSHIVKSASLLSVQLVCRVRESPGRSFEQYNVTTRSLSLTSPLTQFFRLKPSDGIAGHLMPKLCRD